MDELNRCFVCEVLIRPGREVIAQARTGLPEWVQHTICIVCAKRIKELGEVLVDKDDEKFTVRVGSVLDEVVDDVGRQRSS